MNTSQDLARGWALARKGVGHGDRLTVCGMVPVRTRVLRTQARGDLPIALSKRSMRGSKLSRARPSATGRVLNGMPLNFLFWAGLAAYTFLASEDP